MEAKGGAMHLMISYNWDHQPQVVQIKNELENLGYKIWIDLDNLKGNINRAMAEGVEGACAVLICVTDAYKSSYNCEKEAGYADSLRKPILPLKLENGVKFDGWVGPIVSSKLYFDFSDPSQLQEKVKALDAELALTGLKDKAQDPNARPPFLSLDVEGLCRWLKDMEVDDKTVSCFRSNCVTGKDLAVLSKADLTGEDLKIKPFIATKILRNRDEAMGALPPNITARCSTPSEMKETASDDKKKTTQTRKEKLASTKTAPTVLVRYKRGDRVTVLWSSTWYPAEVIEVGPRKLLKIHYEGWDSSYDEKVDYQQCTWRDGSDINDMDKIVVNSKLSYGSYDVEVVEVILASCKIRYDGYGASWDTWVLPNEVKLVEGSRQPQVKQETSKSQGKQGMPSNKYKVGDKIQIRWSNKWYTGHVLELGPYTTFKIHYDSWDDSYDESVDVSKLKYRDGKSISDATKVKNGDGLSALWGGTWYNCTVLAIGHAVCKVRYDQYGPSWDTWCTPDEVKPA